MVCKGEACAECTQNCLLIHQKRDASSIVTSFFKVMMGDHYSTILYLPPKFARTVSALVDQETHLEDSGGRQWTVTISHLDGSMAFQKGWHEFSLDHGLDVGDILVFNYIMGSHFVVQIYGNSGCQKVGFSGDNCNQKKRSRINRNSITKCSPRPMFGNGSMNKQGSSTSVLSGSGIEISQSQPMATGNSSNLDNGLQLVSTPKYVEEPFYMIDKEAGYKQGEDRSFLYDLSNFETGMGRSDADGTNKVSSGDGRTPIDANAKKKSRTELGVLAKDPVVTEVASLVSPSEVADFSEQDNDSPLMDKVAFMLKKNSDGGHSSEHLLETSAVKPAENRSNNAAMLNIFISQNVVERRNTRSRTDHVFPSRKEDPPCLGSGQIPHQKYTGISEFCGSPVPTSMLKCHSGENMKVAEKELAEMGEFYSFEEMLHGKEPKINNEWCQSSRLVVKDNHEAFKGVKTEPFDSFDSSSQDAANISCSVVIGSQTFFELPKCLPTISFRRTRSERVVLLRGSDTKLWPVLYHKKYGLKVLASGWEAFSKANSIQPGDECVFGLENEPESIYRVSIVRK